ncbi:serine hydrolase domain-containing protein [Maricaulis sp.]|uniref:serine hydrolase domain-containing protein n=1 Tax=Maricaulis sp. TaxID=1486257 RepID=UPI002B269AF8|nr:serine hydrolase domain-containing protein [Maricaulis sp.]
MLRSFVIVGAMIAAATVAAVSASASDSDGTDRERLHDIAAQAYDGDRPGASILVFHDGEVLLHEAFGMASLELDVPMATDHRFRVASVTKQFTGAAVMRLVEDGVLDPDADIRTYLPDFPDHGATITLRHLLGHTSGLYNYTNHDDYEAISHTDIDLARTLTYFRDETLDFPVGTDWSYSNSGYALATLIIETVTGDTFANFVETRLFAPAGMSRSQLQRPHAVMAASPSTYWHNENGFYPAPHAGISGHGDGEIHATTGDLLAWYQALWSDRILSPAARQTFLSSQTLPDGRDTRYGMGLFHGRVGEYSTYEHGGNVGGWRAYVIMVPQTDTFVAVLANATDRDEGTIASNLVKAALGLDLAGSSDTAVSLDVDSLARLAGLYRHGPGDERVIRVSDNRLQSRRGGGTWYDLTALTETTFAFAEDADTRITFTEDGLQVSYRYGMDHVATRVEEDTR